MRKSLKLSIAACLILLLSLPLIAYGITTSKSLPERIDEMGDGFVASGSLDQILADIQAATDKGPTVYDINHFLSFLKIGKNGRRVVALSSAPQSLHQINNLFPVTKLTKVSDDLIYATYTVRSEDGTEFHAYVFFELMTSELESYDPENTEQWWFAGQVFFMNKVLSSSAFSEIKLGSSFDAVAAIDSAAALQRKSESAKGVLEFSTYHYLTDGVLCLTFSRKTDSQPFSVSNISLHKNYIASMENSLPMRIRPDDLPI